MLSEKDKSVVYSMCQTGMSLETLKMSFPSFDQKDIEEVYIEYVKRYEYPSFRDDDDIKCCGAKDCV